MRESLAQPVVALGLSAVSAATLTCLFAWLLGILNSYLSGGVTITADCYSEEEHRFWNRVHIMILTVLTTGTSPSQFMALGIFMADHTNPRCVPCEVETWESLVNMNLHLQTQGSVERGNTFTKYLIGCWVKATPPLNHPGTPPHHPCITLHHPGPLAHHLSQLHILYTSQPAARMP